MIKETIAQNGRTYHIRHYGDWLEFVSDAEKVSSGRDGSDFNGMSCSSLQSGKREWYGTDSLNEAINLACHGWPEGRENVRETRKRLQVEKLFPHAQRIIRNIDTSGDEPDIDLFLDGEPEHMVTINEAINPQHGKVLRFIISRSGLADVSANKMVRRGVAVCIALEALIMMGFAVEITIAFAAEEDGCQYEQYVPILHAGDPVNLDTMAFMFLQPAVLRRLGFAAKECESENIRRIFGFYDGAGYSKSCRPKFLPQHELFLDWQEGLVDSDAEIVWFAGEILKKVGITELQNPQS